MHHLLSPSVPRLAGWKKPGQSIVYRRAALDNCIVCTTRQLKTVRATMRAKGTPSASAAAISRQRPPLARADKQKACLQVRPTSDRLPTCPVGDSARSNAGTLPTDSAASRADFENVLIAHKVPHKQFGQRLPPTTVPMFESCKASLKPLPRFAGRGPGKGHLNEAAGPYHGCLSIG